MRIGRAFPARPIVSRAPPESAALEIVLAVTEAPDSFAAAIQNASSVTLAATEAADTLSATVTNAVAVVISASEASDSFAASTANAIECVIDAQEGADSFSATISTGITINAVEAPDTFSAAVANAISVSINAAEAPDTTEVVILGAPSAKVDGGFKGPFRPALPRAYPILLDVQMYSHVALRVAVRSRTSAGQSAQSELVLGRAWSAAQGSIGRAVRSGASLAIDARGTDHRTRASCSRSRLQLVPTLSGNIVRAPSSNVLRLRCAALGASSGTRSARSTASLLSAVRSHTSTIGSARHASRCAVAIAARGTSETLAVGVLRHASRGALVIQANTETETSTRLLRVLEMDVRDLDLVRLVA